jgi:hypothetical protein
MAYIFQTGVQQNFLSAMIFFTASKIFNNFTACNQYKNLKNGNEGTE